MDELAAFVNQKQFARSLQRRLAQLYRSLARHGRSLERELREEEQGRRRAWRRHDRDMRERGGGSGMGGFDAGGGWGQAAYYPEDMGGATAEDYRDLRDGDEERITGEMRQAALPADFASAVSVRECMVRLGATLSDLQIDAVCAAAAATDSGRPDAVDIRKLVRVVASASEAYEQREREGDAADRPTDDPVAELAGASGAADGALGVGGMASGGSVVAGIRGIDGPVLLSSGPAAATHEEGGARLSYLRPEDIQVAGAEGGTAEAMPDDLVAPDASEAQLGFLTEGMLPAESAGSRRKGLDLAAVRAGMDAACGRYGWHDTLWRSAVRGAVAVLASPFASSPDSDGPSSFGGAAGAMAAGGMPGTGPSTSRQIPQWRLPAALSVLGIEASQQEAMGQVAVAQHELGSSAALAAGGSAAVGGSGAGSMPLSEAIVERAARRLSQLQLGRGMSARQVCRIRAALDVFANRGSRPGFLSRSELAYALAGSAVEKAGAEPGVLARDDAASSRAGGDLQRTGSSSKRSRGELSLRDTTFGLGVRPDDAVVLANAVQSDDPNGLVEVAALLGTLQRAAAGLWVPEASSPAVRRALAMLCGPLTMLPQSRIVPSPAAMQGGSDGQDLAVSFGGGAGAAAGGSGRPGGPDRTAFTGLPPPHELGPAVAALALARLPRTYRPSLLAAVGAALPQHGNSFASPIGSADGGAAQFLAPVPEPDPTGAVRAALRTGRTEEPMASTRAGSGPDGALGLVRGRGADGLGLGLGWYDIVPDSGASAQAAGCLGIDRPSAVPGLSRFMSPLRLLGAEDADVWAFGSEQVRPLGTSGASCIRQAVVEAVQAQGIPVPVEGQRAAVVGRVLRFCRCDLVKAEQVGIGIGAGGGVGAGMPAAGGFSGAGSTQQPPQSGAMAGSGAPLPPQQPVSTKARLRLMGPVQSTPAAWDNAREDEWDFSPSQLWYAKEQEHAREKARAEGVPGANAPYDGPFVGHLVGMPHAEAKAQSATAVAELKKDSRPGAPRTEGTSAGAALPTDWNPAKWLVRTDHPRLPGRDADPYSGAGDGKARLFFELSMVVRVDAGIAASVAAGRDPSAASGAPSAAAGPGMGSIGGQAGGASSGGGGGSEELIEVSCGWGIGVLDAWCAQGTTQRVEVPLRYGPAPDGLEFVEDDSRQQRSGARSILKMFSGHTPSRLVLSITPASRLAVKQRAQLALLPLTTIAPIHALPVLAAFRLCLADALSIEDPAAADEDSAENLVFAPASAVLRRLMDDASAMDALSAAWEAAKPHVKDPFALRAALASVLLRMWGVDADVSRRLEMAARAVHQTGLAAGGGAAALVLGAGGGLGGSAAAAAASAALSKSAGPAGSVSAQGLDRARRHWGRAAAAMAAHAFAAGDAVATCEPLVGESSARWEMQEGASTASNATGQASRRVGSSAPFDVLESAMGYGARPGI